MTPGPAGRAARHLWHVWLGALAGALSVAACGGDRNGPEAAPAAAAAPLAPRDTAVLTAAALQLGGFETAPVEERAWRDAVTAPARLVLDPTGTEALGAIAEGRVTRVAALPGDRVRRGQVLVAIHSHEMMDASAQLAAAEAGVAQAATAFRLTVSAGERAERLHQAKALSLADLERARGARADAEARERQARAELARARGMVTHLRGAAAAHEDAHEVLVRAPFDGVVVRRDAEPGAVVLIGAPLVTVSRTTALLLEMHLPENAADVRPGDSVRFATTGSDREVTARVARVSPVVDPATRTVAVHAAVPPSAPGGAPLRAEMTARAELLGRPLAPTLSVPAEAVQAFEGDTVVLTFTRRGDAALVEAVPVRVGRRAGSRAELLGGVRAGAVVVTKGAAVAKAEILRQREGGGEGDGG